MDGDEALADLEQVVGGWRNWDGFWHQEVVPVSGSEDISLLEERIKPAVAQDGGDINFVKLQKGIVFLELRGACSGCPSSTITLKSGIENMLKYYIPEIQSVEAINQ